MVCIFLSLPVFLSAIISSTNKSICKGQKLERPLKKRPPVHEKMVLQNVITHKRGC